MKIKNNFILLLTLILICSSYSYANDKQQIKTKDLKGNTIYVTPNYSSFEERNEQLSEKVSVRLIIYNYLFIQRKSNKLSF